MNNRHSALGLVFGLFASFKGLCYEVDTHAFITAAAHNRSVLSTPELAQRMGWDRFRSNEPFAMAAATTGFGYPDKGYFDVTSEQWVTLPASQVRLAQQYEREQMPSPHKIGKEDELSAVTKNQQTTVNQNTIVRISLPFDRLRANGSTQQKNGSTRQKNGSTRQKSHSRRNKHVSIPELANQLTTLNQQTTVNQQITVRPEPVEGLFVNSVSRALTPTRSLPTSKDIFP